jgi:hypothetical protein
MNALTYLIYWYGSYDDLQNAYSLIQTKDFVDIETGKAKVQKNLETIKGKQINKTKKLTKKEAVLAKSEEEMKKDLEKEPSERRGYLAQFLETYEYDDDDDELVEDEFDEKAELEKQKTKAKNKKTITKKSDRKRKTESNKKKTKADRERRAEEDELINPKSPSDDGGKKKSTKNKKKPPTDSEEVNDSDHNIEATSLPSKRSKTEDGTANSEAMDAIPPPPNATNDPKESKLSAYDEWKMMDEISSHDEADEDYGEFGDDRGFSDDNFDAGDVDREPANSSRDKKRKRSKAAIDGRLKKKKSKATLKKEPSISARQKAEQKQFEFCEEEFLDFLERWEKAIEKRDSDRLLVVYDKLLSIIGNFTAPFMEVYDLNNLMKRSKTILNNEKRKEVMTLFKSTYLAKKEKVPPAFKPLKKSEREEKESCRKKIQQESAEDAAKVKTPSDSTPKDGRNHGHLKIDFTNLPHKEKEDTVDVHSQPKGTSSVSDRMGTNVDSNRRKSTGDMNTLSESEGKKEPERKKKFSLGTLMKSTSSSQLESNGAGFAQPSTANAALSEGTSVNKEAPWTAGSDSAVSTIPLGKASEERELGLAFLDQAAPFVPPAKNVDHTSVARALETATFDFAFKKTSGTTSTSNGSLSAAESNYVWIGLYWDKIHALTAALSGKGQKEGSLARMIAKGDFGSPHEVVKLSDDQLWKLDR